MRAPRGGGVSKAAQNARKLNSLLHLDVDNDLLSRHLPLHTYRQPISPAAPALHHASHIYPPLSPSLVVSNIHLTCPHPHTSLVTSSHGFPCFCRLPR